MRPLKSNPPAPTRPTLASGAMLSDEERRELAKRDLDEYVRRRLHGPTREQRKKIKQTIDSILATDSVESQLQILREMVKARQSTKKKTRPNRRTRSEPQWTDPEGIQAAKEIEADIHRNHNDVLEGVKQWRNRKRDVWCASMSQTNLIRQVKRLIDRGLIKLKDAG